MEYTICIGSDNINTIGYGLNFSGANQMKTITLVLKKCTPILGYSKTSSK